MASSIYGERIEQLSPVVDQALYGTFRAHVFSTRGHTCQNVSLESGVHEGSHPRCLRL
jgi:hypothetical protein